MSESTAVTSWEDELAKQAAIDSGLQTNVGTGNFFSLRGGVLSLNDTAMPGNQIAAVVIDSIFENVYYDTEWAPDIINPPKCYAYARDAAKLAPHPEIVERGQDEHPTCKGCPQNEFGSARRGKGKACGNRQRLSLLSAGALDKDGFTLYDESHFRDSAVAFLKLPVMSVPLYGAYVKRIAEVLKRPLFSVVTLVRVVPDPRSQFKVQFSAIEQPIGETLGRIIMARRNETKSQLEQPYALDFEDAEEEKAPEPEPQRVSPIRATAQKKSARR